MNAAEQEKIRGLYGLKTRMDRFYFRVKFRKGNAMKATESCVPQKGNIIDLGCGDGFFANYLVLKESERKVLGIDLDSKRIARAKKSIQGRKNIDFIVKDLRDIKLKKTDAIIMYDVLHHVTYENQEKILKECYDKLGESGLLIIKDVNKNKFLKYFFFARMIDTLTSLTNVTAGEKRAFRKPEEFSSLLKKIGFNVETKILDLKDITPHVLFICKK